jgi:iron complex outermembrane receptor protein
VAVRLSLLAGAALLATAAWSQAARLPLDIPAQPMDKALMALAAQSGARIVFSTELAERRQAPALRGALTVREALDRLLAGSGLQAVGTADGGFAIRQSPAPAAAAGAQAPAAARALAPVTVLGSRDANVPLSNVPASISILPREEIQSLLGTGARIEDVIAAGAPGFNPTNNGVRQIRGRTAQVFVNGVPTNEQLRASAAADISLLAPDQIDSIEVARGANAAYGFGSPGGIIALNTPRAESDQLTLRSKVSASVNTGHVGDSRNLGIYQSASQILGAFDYHVGFAARRDGLVFDPEGNRALGFDSPVLQANAKERFFDFDTSLGYDFGRAGQLRLAATAGKADVSEAYDSDFSGTYRGAQSMIVRTPAGDDNSRRYHTLNLSYENLRIASTSFKFELLSSRTRTRAFDAFGAPVNLDEQTNSYKGLRSTASTAMDALTEGATLVWGLDVLRNRYFRPYADAATGTVITYFSPDVTLDTTAPHVQLQVPVGPWRFSGGVRHERYRGKVEDATIAGGPVGGDIRPFNLTLFNAGAVYTVRQGREWYASFTQGAEISQLGRDSRGAGAAINVDARPAKSNQYEVGLRDRSSRNLQYGVAAFYTESDLLSALQCDGISPCVPLREPREFWGVEANAKWRPAAQWSLGGTLSWIDGQRTLPTGEKRRIGSRDAPPVLLSANLEHSPMAGWKNRLQVDWRASRDPFGSSTAFGEGRVDSVTLVHLSTTLALGPGQLQVGLRNLFNRKYFSIPVQADNVGFYWVPEQGRRLAVSYAVDW